MKAPAITSNMGRLKMVHLSSNNRRFIGLLQLLLAFLIGCVSSFLLKRMSSLLYGSPDCILSIGNTKYKGMQYISKATVGNPKCLIESKFLKVQQHNVRLTANKGIDEVIEDWIWIDYHDRINVLIEAPQSKNGDEPRFLILEQTKYALEDRTSLAIVGGIIEPGEQPENAALREVLEETGNKCDKLDFLGRYRTDVNRGMGWTNTFIASRCRQSTNAALHAVDEIGKADTEKQDFITMSLSQLREAVVAGKFLEIQWSATVALAILHYDNSGLSL